MEIRLDDEFSIESPSQGSICWVLRHFGMVKSEKKGAKLGERVKRSKDTYHATFKDALKKALDLGLRQCSSTDEIIYRIKDIEHKIDALKLA